jgi:chromosomal replication initiator protein
MAVKGKNNQLNIIWDKALQYLKDLLNEETFSKWITPVIPISFEKDVVVLGVSDAFFISWLQDNFGVMISKALSSSTGQEITVRYEPGHVLPEIEKDNKKAISTKEPQNAGAKRKPLAANCHSRHTFKNFVVGPENEFAVAAALGITKASSSSTNPLFIYGGTGLGKTHLLQAVAHKVSEKNSDAIIEYISCEDFLNVFVDSIKNNRHAKFRNRFRKAD